ncbi:MAG: DUF423 domain-containing protein [Crocinitomicaceae bacterium]|nr:DUF423 domain-containing protein [Crocinitomicaceae bacterium]MBK8926972.1 DUF423 domain-containing protein [Crocinitomicaceae bacterium]
MSKQFIVTGSILICTGILLGAFAAHALEKFAQPNLIDSFEKGVRYQFYAGFALLIFGIGFEKLKCNLRWFFILTLIGVSLFSGCIYLYCFHEKVPVLKFFVYLVPLGGVSFVIAWIVFIFQFVRLQNKQES